MSNSNTTRRKKKTGFSQRRRDRAFQENFEGYQKFLEITHLKGQGLYTAQANELGRMVERLIDVGRFMYQIPYNKRTRMWNDKSNPRYPVRGLDKVSPWRETRGEWCPLWKYVRRTGEKHRAFLDRYAKTHSKLARYTR